jgi:hypothetical protein
MKLVALGVALRAEHAQRLESRVALGVAYMDEFRTALVELAAAA